MNAARDFGQLFASLEPGDLFIFTCPHCTHGKEHTHSCAVLKVEGAGTEKRVWISDRRHDLMHLPAVVVNPLRWDALTGMIRDRDNDPLLTSSEFSVERGGALEALKKYERIPPFAPGHVPVQAAVEQYLADTYGSDLAWIMSRHAHVHNLKKHEMIALLLNSLGITPTTELVSACCVLMAVQEYDDQFQATNVLVGIASMAPEAEGDAANTRTPSPKHYN